jgi:hypothetical protein
VNVRLPPTPRGRPRPPPPGMDRLYKVVGGVRRQITGKNLPVLKNVWHMLGLQTDGEELKVSFNGAKLMQIRDATFVEAGKVGIWTKADSLTHFADIDIETR